jgi:hypothetical protein
MRDILKKENPSARLEEYEPNQELSFSSFHKKKRDAKEERKLGGKKQVKQTPAEYRKALDKLISSAAGKKTAAGKGTVKKAKTPGRVSISKASIKRHPLSMNHFKDYLSWFN